MFVLLINKNWSLHLIIRLSKHEAFTASGCVPEAVNVFVIGE